MRAGLLPGSAFSGGRRLWAAAPAAASALLLLWALLALGLEVQRAAARPESYPGLPPSGWRLGSPQTVPLRSLLARVRRTVPDGALVAVDSAAWREGELFFLMTWCAYDLPRHRVMRLEHLAAVRERVSEQEGQSPPSYLLVAPPGAAILPADWEGRGLRWRQVAIRPGGALYRLAGDRQNRLAGDRQSRLAGDRPWP